MAKSLHCFRISLLFVSCDVNLSLIMSAMAFTHFVSFGIFFLEYATGL